METTMNQREHVDPCRILAQDRVERPVPTAITGPVVDTGAKNCYSTTHGVQWGYLWRRSWPLFGREACLEFRVLLERIASISTASTAMSRCMYTFVEREWSASFGSTPLSLHGMVAFLPRN